MPCALNACATSLSRPAQPPSPDMTMAKLSVGVGPGTAGTSMTGRLPSAAGGSGPSRAAVCFTNASYAAARAGSSSAGASCPSRGRTASAAPCMFAMNARAAAGVNTVSSSPCRRTQGFCSLFAGRNENPGCGDRRVNSTPEPLQSGFATFVEGENPKVTAPAKVLPGACTRLAYASGAPAPCPKRNGGR
jgi:hypothetical protein